MSLVRLVPCVLLLLAAGPAALAQDALRERLLLASPTTIASEPALLELTNSLAEAAIAQHCAACHGPGLEGQPGVPSLVDYEWIWGITGEEVSAAEAVPKIMQSILYGIRDRDCPEDTRSYGACPDTRYSEMPSYRALGLDESQLNGLTDYVLGLSGQPHDADAVTSVQSFTRLCVECHGEGGTGYRSFGGPDLTDDIWLYGGSREAIFSSIAEGRLGYCPPYWDKLDAASIKALGVYIYRRYMGE
jgi:cytochrome c oxidase cbb3-type subunit 3